MQTICSRFSRPCSVRGTMPKMCSRRSLSGLLASVIDLARARCLDAYVYRIARNEASRLISSRKREQIAKVRTESWLMVTENNQELSDLVEQLQIALAHLPQPQREVIVLKIYRQKTFLEISRLLGLSQNTVASRYRYGMEKLRILLENLSL